MWEIRETTSRTGTGETISSVITGFALDEIKFGLFPGTQGCTHKHKKSPHRGGSSEGVYSVVFLASPHQCWMSTLFSLLYLEEEGEWWGGTKTPNNKKGPKQYHYLRDIYCRCLLLFILLFLSLSLCALLSTFTRLHRISLSSALESSSISAHTELRYEKTWRQKSGWDVSTVKELADCGLLLFQHNGSKFHVTYVVCFCVAVGGW